MRYQTCLTLAIGITAQALIPGLGRAQTTVPLPDTGCYAPKTGSAYVIKSQGTPTDCVRKSHYKFPWHPVGPSVVLSGATMLEVDDGFTHHVGPFVHPGSGDLQVSRVQVPLQSGGTVSNLRFYISPSSDHAWQFTLENDGIPTDLSCTISVGNTMCSAEGSVTFAPGAMISIRATSFGGSPARMSWVATLQ